MKSYDKTLTRLILILTKLSNNDRPTIKELAEEFNVGIRTIQRDVYQRLMYFPIEKDKLSQLKFIDGFTLDRCALDNEEMLLLYLSMSQVKDMSPNFETKIDHLLSKLLTPGFSTPYFIKSRSFEKINTHKKISKNLEKAIENFLYIDITYNQTSSKAKPYKIISLDGIWHLLARDMEDDKIKTYIISQVEQLTVLKQAFKLETNIQNILDHVHSSWFEDGNSIDVEIEVNKKIAYYFKSKNVLPTQEILDEYKDGTLYIKFSVTHEEDIDNIIKSWLPDIKVIKPKSYQQKLKNELQNYLDNNF